MRKRRSPRFFPVSYYYCNLCPTLLILSDNAQKGDIYPVVGSLQALAADC
jgi:hypothetical protein